MKKVVVLWTLIAVIFIAGTIFVRGEIDITRYNGYLGMGMRYGDYCYDSDVSYEFLYAHLSEEDQAIVDAQYLLLVSQIDFSVLTLEQQQTEIENIKTQLVDYIYEQDFIIYRRP